ncbi:MAG: hypothetical protein ILP23_04720 [Paludibacteraceae bacterium]|nr:hypothetical protein [Paludibacteraceae bacterium]MBP5136612.1 hypothetical protein [Paludibacteraceae bacterium]
MKLKWSYKMAAFGKSYLVGAEDNGSDYNLYICGEPMFVDMSDEIGILVEHKDISKFNTYLKNVRNKFAQWNKIAKEHNVKNFYKDLAFKYTGCAFYRNKGQYYKVTNIQLDTWFYVDINGSTKIKITTTKYVADGRRSGGRFKIVFSSLAEIDNLIKIVSQSGGKLEEKRRQQSSESNDPIDALFQ